MSSGRAGGALLVHVGLLLQDSLDRFPELAGLAVLVIDEIGYLSLKDSAANVLFQVVNERYLQRKPLLFTTNKPLAAWGHVLHDPDLAEAILDRVLERGRHIQLRGPSYRTRHHPRKEKNSGESHEAPGAIFSGNLVPDFPEPTGE